MSLFLIFTLLAIMCSAQAFCSSMVNQGKSRTYGIFIFILGMGVSFLWVLLSKASTNLIRDGLLWDVIIAAIFSILLIILGHGQHFTLKHWIGMALTLGVFFYWGLIK